MSLKFVTPRVKDGKSVAQIDKHEVKQLSDIWSNVVLFYVVGQTPSIGTIASTEMSICVGSEPLFASDLGLTAQFSTQMTYN